DAAAQIAGGGVVLDHARASIVCRKQANDATVAVEIQKIDLGGGGKTVLVDAGQIDLDTAEKTWKLADLRGRVQFDRPGGAMRTPPSATAPIAAGPVPGTQPAPEAKGIDKLQFAGRGDFTASASGPLKLKGLDPWKAIEHEVVLHPRGVSFLPKNFARRIEKIEGGEVRLTNGTLIFQELSGRCGDDLIRLRSARLPVEELPTLARWQEISGSVTFNPPEHPYSPKLDKILDRLNPRGTFLIAGSYTLDKTGAIRKHDYDLIVSSDSGSMVVTPRKIVIEKIRGDVTVTPAGVDIHAAEADVLGGKVQLTGRYVRQDESAFTYDGEAHLQGVELARLEQSLRDEPPAKPTEGELFAETTFRGIARRDLTAKENLNALEAGGEMEVLDGSFFRMPVLKELAGNVRELKDAATVGSAAAGFEIKQSMVHLSDVAISAPAVGLQGGGKVAFDGAVEGSVVVAPLAEWRDKLRATKIPIVSDVAGTVAGGLQRILNSATGALLYEFRIGGTVSDVKIHAVPTPVLSEAAAYVFGKMLDPQKPTRPREWRRSRERGETK
ncbi:MAG: AsmA-like C-terminal region-containing protein, partial [Tepidisphaeraceae bacterium]